MPREVRWRGPVVGGIPLFDYPKLLRIRLTVCRRNGHRLNATFFDYCSNCAAPWWLSLEEQREGER